MKFSIDNPELKQLAAKIVNSPDHPFFYNRILRGESDLHPLVVTAAMMLKPLFDRHEARKKIKSRKRRKNLRTCDC
jgi:hypothetical protein